MKKRKALTKYLGLMISLDPQSLLGMEEPETNLKFAQNVFIHLRDTFSNRLSASLRKADVGKAKQLILGSQAKDIQYFKQAKSARN